MTAHDDFARMGLKVIDPADPGYVDSFIYEDDGSTWVFVQWLDSCVLHGQVDAKDLPTPSTLETVGWLSFHGSDHIVVSRDHSPSPDSYSWRSSVAIPHVHIVKIQYLVPSRGLER